MFLGEQLIFEMGGVVLDRLTCFLEELRCFFGVSKNFFEYIIKVEELIHKLGVKTKVINMKLSQEIENLT